MNTEMLSRLQAIVGEAHVLTSGDLSAYERDWRKRYAGIALAVVRPASTEQVAAVIRCAQAHGVSVVPQGGNTGLVGGGVPDTSGRQIVLSTTRMNRVLGVDRANASMTVQAGCTLQQAQTAAADQGLLFPLSLASEGTCTVGGNLATNAGGTQVLRYGNARDLCLGLEAVNAQGEAWHGLSGLRKDNTGFDLRHLFIGSEGCLGVITAATLKLFPQPRAQVTATASCHSLEAAVQLLGIAQSHAGASVTAFELMNTFSLRLVARHFPQLPQALPSGHAPWTVLLELSDAEDERHAQARFEALLGNALSQGVIHDTAVAQTLAQSQGMWHVRDAISLAQGMEGLNIKHDIAVPVSGIPAFVHATDAALAKHWPGVRMVCFGHLGDGNLHYNVQAPAGQDAAGFLQREEKAINTLVYDAVCAAGGSISAEHGIGQLKREELARRKDPTALAMMRAIKQALDPQGLMNPGRVL